MPLLTASLGHALLVESLPYIVVVEGEHVVENAERHGSRLALDVDCTYGEEIIVVYIQKLAYGHVDHARGKYVAEHAPEARRAAALAYGRAYLASHGFAVLFARRTGYGERKGYDNGHHYACHAAADVPAARLIYYLFGIVGPARRAAASALPGRICRAAGCVCAVVAPAVSLT